MLFFFYLLILIFGLVVGSFLNSIIYRLSTGESFLFKRSFCPHCKHKLGWQDLIPLLSFLILRGKCRYCSQKISIQYPIVEIATGLLFLSIFIFQLPETSFMETKGGEEIFNFLRLSIFTYLAACFLIIIFVYDLKHYIIPDKIIYPAIILSLIFNFQFLITKQFSIFNYSILSAILAAAFFLAIVLVSRGKWMGVGDIKLAFFMGLFLGWPNILVALFLAFFIGAIIGVGLIASQRKTLRSEVPFGPFLVVGTFVALFWGQNIIHWYLNFCNSL